MSQMEYQVLLVSLAGGLAALVILGIFLLIAIRMLQGGRKRKDGVLEQESKLIQEMYQGLQRMENRIEALETLLYEPRPGKGNRHD